MRVAATVLVLAVAVMTFTARAETAWQRHVVEQDFFRPNGVAAGDFNGDGYIDIVGSNHSPETFAWYESDGQTPPNFTRHTIYGPSNFGGFKEVFAIDLDQNGTIDFLSASDEWSDLTWWRNNGQGNFSQVTIDGYLYYVDNLHVADIDDDGDFDVVASGKRETAWYEQTSPGSFAKHHIFNTNGIAKQVYAADFDGNGHLEIVVGDGQNDVIQVWQNDGFENFSVAATIIGVDAPHDVYAADINGDGAMDIIATDLLGDYIAWWENDGSQGFSTKHTVRDGFDAPSKLVVTDINGDSHLDIVSGAYYTGGILWWENDGQGNFPPENEHEIDAQFLAARYLWAEDIDGNGVVDILAAGDNGISWFENPGCWLFALALDIKPGSCPNPLNVKKPKSDVGMLDPDQPDDAAYKAGPGLSRTRAVLPVAILGTADFDVTNIDPATVTLEGVPALRWAIEDVSTPVGDGAAECECTDAGPDGYPDLTIKFDKSSIVASLGVVYDGDTIPLTISGQLIDGTPFEGTDCVVILGSTAPAVASTPVLNVNYPNPFNPVTQISFSLPDAAEVSLEIYNIMGQQVAVIVDGPMDAGTHTVQWDGSDVASGIYFYRLQASDIIETKKMVLLK